VFYGMTTFSTPNDKGPDQVLAFTVLWNSLDLIKNGGAFINWLTTMDALGFDRSIWAIM
jgi:hypothetical protein